jgi:dienelactone hydrolase
MIRQTHGSAVAVVVLHEIYGLNRHVEEVCLNWSRLGYDVVAPDLLAGRVYAYEQESEAYRAFMEGVGFAKAAGDVRVLLDELRTTHIQVFVGGYSIGATIGWMVAKQGGVDGLAGYYGSRIRDYIDVPPHCPTMLFFPEKKASFEVTQLRDELSAMDDVQVRLFPGEHGFADPFSGQYVTLSAKEADGLSISFIRGLQQG